MPMSRTSRRTSKSSWKEAQKGLNKVADTLGRHRLAREIEPDEVANVIRPIYERGARAIADHVRSYVRSAYSWGMKSEHDYRNSSLATSGLPTIRRRASRPSQRMSAPAGWMKKNMCGCIAGSNAPTPPYIRPTRAVRILMLTGQRVEEIARLHVDQWDAAENYRLVKDEEQPSHTPYRFQR